MAKGASLIGSKQEEDEWRAECDMRTLMEAEEIKRDRKRHDRATAMAKQKLIELASVAGEADKAKA